MRSLTGRSWQRYNYDLDVRCSCAASRAASCGVRPAGTRSQLLFLTFFFAFLSILPTLSKSGARSTLSTEPRAVPLLTVPTGSH